MSLKEEAQLHMPEAVNVEGLITKQERINSPSKFAIYCNSTELSISPWDIRFTLMEALGLTGDTVAVVIHGSVAMSPAHAKVFMEALAQSVKSYEEKFGEIDVSKIKEALSPAPPSLP
jgi:Protein of unknown function (DUF3467)